MQDHPLLSLEGYCEHNRKHGINVVLDSQGSAWIKYEGFAVQRYPTFTTTLPNMGELASICREARVAIASYIVEPDDVHPANSFLYVGEAGNYNLQKLPYSTRKNIKRAMHDLSYMEIDWSTLQKCGLQAFLDTRERAQLSDNTVIEFEKRIQFVKGLACHHIIGCFIESHLTAYLGLVIVDDFAEITFWYSENKYLGSRPNDGLFYYTLNLFLNERGLRLISDGLSSLQPDEGSGLHHFKVRLGLQAKPVHRAFYVHPVLRPFINRFTLGCAKASLTWLGANRRVRKIIGVMAIILQPTHSRSPVQSQVL